MTTGIVIFAYNRAQHLSKVLEGLRQNKDVQEIYIFQDGLKKEEHRDGWEYTQKVIEAIDWCKVQYTLAPENKGLAQSIVNGITKILEIKDSVIVLEDDCVPTPNFISFMLQCLSRYVNDKKVYNISGYSWPINMKGDGKYDVYFNGRTCSWGWGTWKDRWKQYEVDNYVLDRIKSDEKKSINLALWCKDVEKTFLDRLEKKNDSWAVYWSLMVIELGGICVSPFQSLIQNIGYDGSGVHCPKTDKFRVDLEQGKERKYKFPENEKILDETKEVFASFTGSYTAINCDDMKEHILVYGLGDYFGRYEKQINEKYYIKAFIDREKKGYYAGKKIIKVSDIRKHCDVKIIIMIQDALESMKVSAMLNNEYQISKGNIIIGKEIYGKCE